MAKRKRLTRIKLNEISGVDNPAQEGALAVIVKRDDGTSGALEDVIPAPETEGLAQAGEEAKTMSKTDETVDVGKLREELAEARALASLTDEHRQHFAKLDEEAKREFLAMTPEARGASIAEANAEDRVVYKALDGTLFRESDDPRFVAMAKRADEAEKRAVKAEAASETRDLEKRADETLKYLPGTAEVRGAILKAVDGIEDAEIREKAHAAIKAGDNAMSRSYDEQGIGKSEEVTDANVELEKRAKAHAEKRDISYAKAYREVLGTPEGKALYQRTVS